MKKKTKNDITNEVNDILIEAICKIQEKIEKHMSKTNPASLLDFMIPYNYGS